jgi:hypothetical protein
MEWFMDKAVTKIEENRNLIQTASATVASMGLDKVGQKVAGVMVTPAVWLFNYAFLKAKPDSVDLGIYATGFLSAGASTAVGLLKSHVDDSMNKKLVEVQRRESPKLAPYIKNCYHYSSAPASINAQAIASEGGTAWLHPNGLWVYITDAYGRMVKDFKPNVYVVIYQPKEPLVRKNGKFVWGAVR